MATPRSAFKAGRLWSVKYLVRWQLDVVDVHAIDTIDATGQASTSPSLVHGGARAAPDNRPDSRQIALPH